MDHNENENSYATVSLGTLWSVLRRCWYWMLLGAVVVGVVIFGLYKLVYTPAYSSTSEFYVSNIAETTSLYSSSQTQGAEAMAKTFVNLVKADKLIDEVREDTGLNAYSRDQLRKLISAKSDGAILYVTVSGTNASLNYRVSQSLEKYLPAYCDYYNNQVDALNASHESKTLKVIRTSVLDQLADNRSNLYRYPVLAALLAAVAVYAVFFLIAITNTTIYSVEDLKTKAPQYSVVGAIAHWPLEGEKKLRRPNKRRDADVFRLNVDQKLLLRDHVPFRITEAFHELRTNITFCAAGETGCTIGVISSVAGSGKSFVMSNLAVSLSKLYDKKVLLIDGDMRCPMIHKIFSLPNKKGLSNLIANQVEDAAAIKHSFGNLDVITSGTLPPNPIDLLSGPRMKELTEEWKRNYDYVLIDLPPIGEVSDALAISGLISGYIIVIRSGYMDSRLLRDTAEVVESKSAKIYGYVLTDVRLEHTEGYSKYGYYHKYARYGKYQAYSNFYAEAEKTAAEPAESDRTDG